MRHETVSSVTFNATRYTCDLCEACLLQGQKPLICDLCFRELCPDCQVSVLVDDEGYVGDQGCFLLCLLCSQQTDAIDRLSRCIERFHAAIALIKTDWRSASPWIIR